MPDFANTGTAARRLWGLRKLVQGQTGGLVRPANSPRARC